MDKVKQRNSALTHGDYEKLGRSIEWVLASDFITRRRLFWLNFQRGIFFGLGATLGGTIVITFLVWLLSHFTQLPLIGDLVETVENSLIQN